jgi:hypothetical protein
MAPFSGFGVPVHRGIASNALTTIITTHAAEDRRTAGLDDGRMLGIALGCSIGPCTLVAVPWAPKPFPAGCRPARRSAVPPAAG